MKTSLHHWLCDTPEVSISVIDKQFFFFSEGLLQKTYANPESMPANSRTTMDAVIAVTITM